ncbi:alkane 1-monooxygenase [Thioclava sp. 'Guangxiensis']|uniref:alkane 1-monooxygenase n=1 Tax=Thioclava sp. 'Guangxiensis' TaxID=3149044 RepID=UPI003877DD63
MRQTLPFVFATLVPMGLVIVAACLGGWWCLLALLATSTFLQLLDLAHPAPRSDAPEGTEFPAGNGLLVMISLGYLAAVGLAIDALLTGWGMRAFPQALAKLALFTACGFTLGQLCVPAAHELIHRPRKGLVRLGQMIYITLLFGHHASAHRLVHHIHVATPLDPNSAPRGLGFWRFLPRAWIGSWQAGWQAENRLRQRRALPLWRTPYTAYLAGAALSLGLVGVLFGPWGIAIYLALCAHAQIQLLLADYIQHYGLRRVKREGRYEPVGPHHSWDACPPASAFWMLNAPRHSDHHAHPSRPYAGLRMGTLTAQRPILPRSLPSMAVIALFPTLWRKIMDPRLDALDSRRRAQG